MAQHPDLPSRRTLAKGAAWSIPLVTVGAAAPAYAASPNAVTVSSLILHGIRLRKADGTNCASNQGVLYLNGTNGAVPDPLTSASTAGYGEKITNNTNQTITPTSVTYSFWATTPTLTLVAQPGYTTWSAFAPTGTTRVYNSVTYYEFKTTYTGTMPSIAPGGTTILTMYWIGNTCYSSINLYDIRLDVVVNGTTFSWRSNNGGVRCTPTGNSFGNCFVGTF